MTAPEYNTCVRSLSDGLYRFALKTCGNAEDAQDAVQTAFAALWEARDTVPPERAKAYLFQVGYRQAVNAFRHNLRHAPVSADAADAAEEDAHAPPSTLRAGPAPPADLRRHLDRALLTLSQQSRALVLLKDYEGYSYEEIGRIAGLTDSQVRVYLHRARKALKAYLVSVEMLIG